MTIYSIGKADFLHYLISSKRDIPVSNYSVHTLQCSRHLLPCKHCPDVRLARRELEAHIEAEHAIKVCSQCGISVEAGKLHDHMVSLMRGLIVSLSVQTKRLEDGVG